MAVFRTTVENLKETLQSLQELNVVQFSQTITVLLDELDRVFSGKLPLKIEVLKSFGEVLLVVDYTDFTQTHPAGADLKNLLSPKFFNSRVAATELIFQLPGFLMPPMPMAPFPPSAYPQNFGHVSPFGRPQDHIRSFHPAQGHGWMQIKSPLVNPFLQERVSEFNDQMRRTLDNLADKHGAEQDKEKKDD